MREEFCTADIESASASCVPTRPPFGYYGAKQRISSKIISMLPPHNAWVEAFCGSAAISLAKPQAPIEVINDLDGRIVNVFNQLRNNSEELCRRIALTPYSWEEYTLAKQKHQTKDLVEDARCFLVQAMMAINGTIDPNTNSVGFSQTQSYSRAGREARVNRWYNLPTRLERVAERIRNMRIERCDARELMLKFHDRPATLAYLDPPYFTKRSHGYVIDAKDNAFHQQLLEIIVTSKAMILLSGYDNKLYEEKLMRQANWTKHIIQTTTRNTKGVEFKREEVLWSNSRFEHAAKLNRIPIRLSKQERLQKKLNPSRKWQVPVVPRY